MAIYDDLTVNQKRDYIGWRIAKEREIVKQFDNRAAQFKELKDVLSVAERNKIKSNGETEIDARFQALDVDAFLAEPVE